MTARAGVGPRHEEAGNGWPGVVAFIALCGATGAGLWYFTGPPTILISVQDWSHVRDVLGGSQLRDDDVIAVVAAIGWLILGYLMLSVALRLVFGIAVAVTGGAAWARAGLRVTTPMTIPFVRRMVDGALAGTIFMTATFHAPTAAFASGVVPAPIEAPFHRHVAGIDASALAPSLAPSVPSAMEAPTSYTVAPGDHLWGIAERFLGDGFRWVDIWQLNQQHTMTDGRSFVDPNLIYAGWQLELPQDAGQVDPTPVGDDDTLDLTPVPEAEPTEKPEPEIEPSPTATTPLPADATPTTTPSPVAAAPVASRTGSPTNDDAGGSGTRLPMPALPVPDGGVVASLAGLAAGGVAMFLVFRRVRRRDGEGVGGGVERRPTGTGDAGRVLAMAAALRTALVELDFGESQVMLARESQHYIEFTLDCPPGDADALVDSRHTFARQLGCAVDGAADGLTTVRLKLSRMSHLATSLFGGARFGPDLLVPVGASDSGIVYLNLAGTGNVLVAGGRLQTRELVGGWIETLASLGSDDMLALTVDAHAREHLGAAADLLPGDADPARDDDSLARWARGIEETLMDREENAPDGRLLAVTGPDDDVAQAVGELDGVMRLGPARGVYLVVVVDTEPGAADRRAFGAVVALGDDQSEGVRLTIGQQPSVELEPVVVRREVAHRPPPSDLKQDLMPLVDSPSNGHHEDADWSEMKEVLADDLGTETPAPASPANRVRPEEDLPDSPEVEPGGLPAPAPFGRQSALPMDEGNSEVVGRSPPYRARLFGTFHFETDQGEVTGWSIQKARELLAYLLAHGGAQVLRETVAEALWRGAPVPQAMHQLSNAAYYLRRTLSRHVGDLETQLLVVANGRYHLRPGSVRTDVDAFDAHLARADRLSGYEALVEYERALALYGSGFLEGETFEWADVYRRDYQTRFSGAAQRAARIALDGRDPKLARGFYEAVLRHDPIDEEAVRGLLRCFIALEDRNAARHAYKQLQEALREALDDEHAEPMPTTAKLFEEVLNAS